MKKSLLPTYRYIILLVFMLVNIAIEIQWLAHAAVARPAQVFYADQVAADSFFNIDFLAMVYMLVFLVISFPASYIIDTYGIKKGLTIGSVLLMIFSVTKAIFAGNFAMVVVSQTGLAIAQPFILNAVTALTVRWFPLKERALAAGLATLAQFIGIVIAMLVTPLLIGSDPSRSGYGEGFEGMLYIYAAFSVLSALLCIFLIKESPALPVGEELPRYTFFKGLKSILRNRDMIILILLFMVGLGIFNAISSMTDALAEHTGISDSDGLIGGLMLIGGILGALVIPALSDKFLKRKFFIKLCMFGMLPGLLGIAFPDMLSADPESIYTISLISSFILGFFIMSAGPIGFQYAAEVSYPAPESASQGILLWIGQISGMLFVAGMSIRNNAFLEHFLALFVILTVSLILLSFFLRESKIILDARK